MRQLRARHTYANVMSTIAVFGVLAGGSFAVAATLAKNSVGTKQIEKNAVKEAEIAKNAVTAKKIARGAVSDAKLGAISVGNADLEDNSVSTGKIQDDAVSGAKVNESTLGEVPLAAAAQEANNVFSAVVNSSGSLATSTQPGTTSGRNGLGNYSVGFGRDLTGCSAVATLGNAGAAIPNPGEIGTSLLNFGGPTSTVQVQTRNSSGAEQDNGFHVVVIC
jgi:hypothetical protein